MENSAMIACMHSLRLGGVAWADASSGVVRVIDVMRWIRRIFCFQLETRVHAWL